MWRTPSACRVRTLADTCRRQRGIVQSRNLVPDLAGARVAGIEIGQHHHCQAVIHVAADVRGETLPGAAMFDDFVAVLFADGPGRAVIARVGLAVVQRKDGPHPVERRLLDELFGIERLWSCTRERPTPDS